MYDFIYSAFLALYDIVKNLWYHIGYHRFYYDIMYDIRKWIIKNVSCATHAMILPMISYVIQQKSYVFDHDIINFWYYSWYHGRFRTITPMISVTYDITALWYHNFHDILAHTAWYHGTCATGWRWLGAPRASRSAFPGLAIANVLGTGVQLNGDRLDPPHGLVAVAAAWIVSGCRLVALKEIGSPRPLLWAVQPMQANL